MPGLARDSLICPSQEQVEWDRDLFLQPRDPSYKPEKIFYLGSNIPERCVSHPPPLVFSLASLADSFSPAQSFAGFSTGGKACNEVTLIMYEGHQPFIPPSHSTTSCVHSCGRCHLGSSPCRVWASSTFSHKVDSHCLGPQAP